MNNDDKFRRVCEKQIEDLLQDSASALTGLFEFPIRDGAISTEEVIEFFDDFFRYHPNILLETIIKYVRAMDSSDSPPKGLDFPEIPPSDP